MRGRVAVDAGAQRAVSSQGTSLLAVGVTAVDGTFSPGDAVELTGPDEKPFAVGIASRSAADVRAAVGYAAQVKWCIAIILWCYDHNGS